MPRFAVMQGNLIVNSIVADSQEIAEEVTGQTCIFSDLGLGWVYDEKSKEFIAPEQSAVEIVNNTPILINEVVTEKIVEPIIEEPLPLAE